MLKATLTTDPKTLLFGISKRNVQLLKQGKPIRVDLREMGVDALMVIFYSETEEGLVTAVTPMITKDTKIHEQE